MSDGFVLERPFDPNSIPGEGTFRRFSATPEELQNLAKVFDLLDFESLSAEIALTRWHGDGVALRGRIAAKLTQACVVTLEPVVQTVDETFEVHMVPAGSRLAVSAERRAEIAVDPLAEDPPDVYSGKHIDLGAIVQEHLALAIDPYPRAPGAALPEAFVPGPEDGQRPDSPFAALAALAPVRKDDT